jgi:hypothetical protein
MAAPLVALLPRRDGAFGAVNECAILVRRKCAIYVRHPQHRLTALRAELATLDTEPEIRVRLPVSLRAPIPRTSADKLRLFRSLFRGREDIFPTRFVSARTGKSGYAPACRNKFVRGVCELPKVKCGDCPNQAFIPFDDPAVVGHLTGRHVMGIYPLLEDETCWFLAVDFDKSTWVDDVGAFVETCQHVGLPAAVERSRSGDGAHVWFFFSSPVLAATARKMGCYRVNVIFSLILPGAPRLTFWEATRRGTEPRSDGDVTM